jgi:hypothetical protein
MSGIYNSACHRAERTVLEGQPFPTCGYCNLDTQWICVGSDRRNPGKDRAQNQTVTNMEQSA